MCVKLPSTDYANILQLLLNIAAPDSKSHPTIKQVSITVEMCL